MDKQSFLKNVGLTSLAMPLTFGMLLGKWGRSHVCRSIISRGNGMFRPVSPGIFVAIVAYALMGLTACGKQTAGERDVGPKTPGVDAVFADILAEGPGAAVIVMEHGQVVHRAGYGMAHLDHGIPISPETVFDIASISKQFGAIAALLLEADGKLDFNADVRTYVPELPSFGHTITVRHLVHHTSGIRDWPHVMALAGVEMSDVISFEKILRMLLQQKSINFPPGSEYAYSNTGYNLLALIIERTSGMSFREFTSERIFKPLGMANTHFSDNYNEVVPGRAESYHLPQSEENGGGYQRSINQLTALASSSLNTTIDDFALWMKNYETGQVGSKAMISRMTQRGVLTSGETIDYAYGLVVEEYRGLLTYRHGGSWAGNRSSFNRFPEQNLSVAVFCNFATCDAARRAREVSEVYLAEVMGPSPPDDPPTASSGDSLNLSESQLAEFVGDYRSPELDSSYKIIIQDGRLMAEHWRNRPSVLTPRTADSFEGDQWWFPEVRFVRDGRGRVNGFMVSGPRVRNLIFERSSDDAGSPRS